MTATASFAAILDDSPNGGSKMTLAEHPLARDVAILISAICSLNGIYATVVFFFSSIYGRTGATTKPRHEAAEFRQSQAIIGKHACSGRLLRQTYTKPSQKPIAFIGRRTTLHCIALHKHTHTRPPILDSIFVEKDRSNDQCFWACVCGWMDLRGIVRKEFHPRILSRKPTH
jgi:hypothetical protein